MVNTALRILSGFLLISAVASPSHAATVADQRGFSPASAVSGGFTGTVAQSFQPGLTNLAGVDVFLFSVAKFISGGGIDYTADVSLSVFTASDPEDATYLAEPPIVAADFALDTMATREGWAEFRFAPVAVIPDTYYILELMTDNGAFGTSSNDGYTRGQVIEPGLGRDYFDVHFVTNAAVPVPAAWALFTPLLAATGWYGRRRR